MPSKCLTGSGSSSTSSAASTAAAAADDDDDGDEDDDDASDDDESEDQRSEARDITAVVTLIAPARMVFGKAGTTGGAVARTAIARPVT